MKRLLLSLSLCLLGLAPLAAHGPNCKCHLAPGQVTPPNGGLLEFSDNHVWVELIDDTEPMEIYLYEANLEDSAMDHVDIQAKLIMPKRSKAKGSIELERDGDRYLAWVELEGRVHRYTIEFKLKHDGEIAYTRYDVEP